MMPELTPELSTFENIDIQKALRHLKKADKRFTPIIKAIPAFEIKPNNTNSLFTALIESIIYQQLTAKAAETIYKRVLRLFSNSSQVLPLDVIRASEEELRAAGLSRNKAIAIKDLAEFALAQKLPDENKIKQMTNEEIIETLTQIKGIGRWTVEMILIFRLGRADVTSLKDYGLQKGLALLMGTFPTLPSITEFREQSEKWKPYRSIATWYLWRVADSYNATNKK